MILRFQKGLGGADTLLCLRRDGSVHEETLPPGCIHHDLAHFAVETTMGFQDGVIGMLARGHRIADYGQAEAAHGVVLTTASYHAEYLSTLVQSAVYTGQIPQGYYDMLASAAAASGLPFPALPAPEVLAACIACARDLHTRWLALDPEDTLELEFPE
jgi:hypothetical protein